MPRFDVKLVFSDGGYEIFMIRSDTPATAHQGRGRLARLCGAARHTPIHQAIRLAPLRVPDVAQIGAARPIHYLVFLGH
jgi:hypothetical protein